MIARIAGAFFRKGLQEALSYRVAFGLRLVVMLVSLSSFFYLAQFIDRNRSQLLVEYGGDYLSFGLFGMILLNLQFTSVSAYPKSIRQAQIAGTLEAMLATPSPPWLILICSPLYAFFSSFLWASLYLLIGKLFFGVRFENSNLLSVGVALPLTLTAFASLGFWGASLTMLFRRSDPISTVLSGLSSLLSGVFYPTSVLPNWLRTMGKLLPITHSLEMLRRAVFRGASLAVLAEPIWSLCLFCALSLPGGLLFFAWALRRTRIDGSLTHF